MAKEQNWGSEATEENPVLLTVEEHAKLMKVSGPIFAGVLQKAGWASGKKVTKTEFESAVKAFLGAPMGGR